MVVRRRRGGGGTLVEAASIVRLVTKMRRETGLFVLCHLELVLVDEEAEDGAEANERDPLGPRASPGHAEPRAARLGSEGRAEAAELRRLERHLARTPGNMYAPRERRRRGRESRRYAGRAGGRGAERRRARSVRAARGLSALKEAATLGPPMDAPDKQPLAFLASERQAHANTRRHPPARTSKARRRRRRLSKAPLLPQSTSSGSAGARPQSRARRRSLGESCTLPRWKGQQESHCESRRHSAACFLSWLGSACASWRSTLSH